MKKQSSLVSVLIINYNNANYIQRAVKSCLDQTYLNIEILIYDDKSTDNSTNILNKFNKNKKIKIFYNKSKKKKIPSFDAMNGYLFLYKRSKGNIICLLDSDDYFHKKKIKEIVKFFKVNKNISLVQNLPYSMKVRNINNEKKINNPLSFWPYLAPESCISFRKSLLTKFLKINFKYLYLHRDVWFGFKIGVYAYYIEKNFGTIKKYLTFYNNFNESKKYKTFNINWFVRRNNSFDFLNRISNKKVTFKNNLDYIITNLLSKKISKYEKKNQI